MQCGGSGAEEKDEAAPASDWRASRNPAFTIRADYNRLENWASVRHYTGRDVSPWLTQERWHEFQAHLFLVQEEQSCNTQLSCSTPLGKGSAL